MPNDSLITTSIILKIEILNPISGRSWP